MKEHLKKVDYILFWGLNADEKGKAVPIKELEKKVHAQVRTMDLSFNCPLLSEMSRVDNIPETARVRIYLGEALNDLEGECLSLLWNILTGVSNEVEIIILNSVEEKKKEEWGGLDEVA